MGRFPLNQPRRKTKLILVLACGAAWCAMATSIAWAGTIEGTVRFIGPHVAKKLKVTIDSYICGKYKDDESLVLSPGKGIRNAVVSLLLPPSAREEVRLPPVEVKMNQKKCMFVPHVLVMPVGGTLKFLSSDRLLHNIKTESRVNPQINRAQPKGRTISIKYNKPETILIQCDLHSWMRAWVVVAEHPFYAVTNDQGGFVLDNVPPGKYTLQVWQESLGIMTKEVTITAKGMHSVTLEMGKK